MNFRRFNLIGSLQWRLVTIFILLTFVLMISAGISLNYFVENFYYDTFKAGIENGFEYWGIDSNANPKKEEILEYLTANNKANAMSLFSINNFRSFTVIDMKTNEILYTDERMPYRETLGQDIQSSRNYLAVLAGKAGDQGKLIRIGDKVFFDYARRIGNSDYVLYFRYDREEWAGAMRAFNKIIRLSFVIAVILSMIFGYALSKTITVPIVNLMHKARKMASGDFDQVVEVKSDDEIGKLTRTFNFMAKELKNTLNQISREKSKIETILNFMTDGVIAFDVNGAVIHINPAAKRILKIDEFSLDFNDFSKKYDLGVSIEEIKYLEKYSTKEVITDIGEKFVRICFALFTDKENNAEGIIAVLHDITEEQKLENMRKEFVANVSHELRTPLTSIKSYSETLLDGALEDRETAEKFLGVINSEADRMTRLVKDLLQLSRLDNKQMKWNMQEFSFEDLVKSCVEKVRFSSNEKKQILECFTIGEISNIVGDKDRIEQVILNILTNAIKYTPEKGEIWVHVYCERDMVIINVSDNGIGIPESDLNRIFERFFRVDKARSRQMGGTGLGLSIAKEIAVMHGGDITVKSKLGKGTSVFIKLPVQNRQKKAL